MAGRASVSPMVQPGDMAIDHELSGGSPNRWSPGTMNGHKCDYCDAQADHYEWHLREWTCREHALGCINDFAKSLCRKYSIDFDTSFEIPEHELPDGFTTEFKKYWSEYRNREQVVFLRFYSSPIGNPFVGKTWNWWGHDCRICEHRWYTIDKTHRSYCSDECRRVQDARRNRTARAREKRPLPIIECEHCGQPVDAERSTRRFCSSRCRVAAHRAKPAEVET